MDFVALSALLLFNARQYNRFQVKSIPDDIHLFTILSPVRLP